MSLPCGATCPGANKQKLPLTRFHITCLWCRTRRKRVLTKKIFYNYISMPPGYAQAYQIDYARGCVNHFIVKIPQILIIDPAGHFTSLRCYMIRAIDTLAAKLHLHNSHRVANLCEFLANYPIW